MPLPMNKLQQVLPALNASQDKIFITANTEEIHDLKLAANFFCDVKNNFFYVDRTDLHIIF